MAANVKILHNPRCTKSREALNYLQSKNLEVDICDYLKDGISKEELKSFIGSTGLSVSELLRTNEIDYKEHLKGRVLSDEEILDFMIKYPKIIQRPIVMSKNKGVMARPFQLIDQII